MLSLVVEKDSQKAGIVLAPDMGCVQIAYLLEQILGHSPQFLEAKEEEDHQVSDPIRTCRDASSFSSSSFSP